MEQLKVVTDALTAKKKALLEIERSLRTCEARNDGCMVDLHLTKASMDEAEATVHELQRKLNKEDCSAVKRDMGLYRDQAEQCMLDLKGLKAKVDHLEKDNVLIPDLRGRAEKAEGEVVKLESMLKTSKSELNATQTALHSLLASLDNHLQYLQLKDEHEKEILPFWLDQMVKRGTESGRYIYGHKLLPLLDRESTRATLMYQKGVKAAQIAFVSLDDIISSYVIAPLRKYLSMLDTLLKQHVPSWNVARNVAVKSWNVVSIRIRLQKEAFAVRIVKEIKMIETLLYRKLKRTESLEPLARVDIVQFIVRGGLLACVVPMLFLAIRLTITLILYLFRPGSSYLQIVSENDAIRAIENGFNYRFHEDGKIAVLRAVAGSEFLESIGMAVVSLIIVESGGTKSMDLNEFIRQRACTSSLNSIVKAGPGRRSSQARLNHLTQLYVSILASIFEDSGKSVMAVRRILYPEIETKGRNAIPILDIPETPSFSSEDDEDGDTFGESDFTDEEHDSIHQEEDGEGSIQKQEDEENSIIEAGGDEELSEDDGRKVINDYSVQEKEEVQDEEVHSSIKREEE